MNDEKKMDVNEIIENKTNSMTSSDIMEALEDIDYDKTYRSEYGESDNCCSQHKHCKFDSHRIIFKFLGLWCKGAYGLMGKHVAEGTDFYSGAASLSSLSWPVHFADGFESELSRRCSAQGLRSKTRSVGGGIS